MPGLGVAIISLLAVFVFRKQPQTHRLWFGCIAILCLGATRYTAATPTIAPTDDPNNIAFYNGHENAIITGLVISEPEFSDRWVRLRCEMPIRSPCSSKGVQPVEGEILITIPRFSDILYGTRLQINGRLEAPAK